MKERVSFWAEADIVNSVRQKILDHKIETGERVTITTICTKALEAFAKPERARK